MTASRRAGPACSAGVRTETAAPALEADPGLADVLELPH
jgi:hypothetical protein